jgi:hypothetical protein
MERSTFVDFMKKVREHHGSSVNFKHSPQRSRFSHKSPPLSHANSAETIHVGGVTLKPDSPSAHKKEKTVLESQHYGLGEIHPVVVAQPFGMHHRMFYKSDIPIDTHEPMELNTTYHTVNQDLLS